MWINGQTYNTGHLSSFSCSFYYFLLFLLIFLQWFLLIFYFISPFCLFLFSINFVYWYFLKAGSRIYAFLCLCVDVLKHIYMGEYINIHRQVVSSIRQFGTFSRAGALFTCAYTCVIGSLIPLFMYFSRLFLVLSWFPF